MQDRSVRNRKRSKRRAIFCPIHNCYLDSVSQKFSLYADQVEQLRHRGIGKLSATLLMANATTVSLPGEWLEAFWCEDCQCTTWYYIHKQEKSYFVKRVPEDLWPRASGVSSPDGNPSVGEFTRRQSRAHGVTKSRDFGFVLS